MSGQNEQKLVTGATVNWLLHMINLIDIARYSVPFYRLNTHSLKSIHSFSYIYAGIATVAMRIHSYMYVAVFWITDQLSA